MLLSSFGVHFLNSKVYFNSAQLHKYIGPIVSYLVLLTFLLNQLVPLEPQLCCEPLAHVASTSGVFHNNDGQLDFTALSRFLTNSLSMKIAFQHHSMLLSLLYHLGTHGLH